MNKYLMAVYHYFRGYEEFEIEAENRQDALDKSKEFLNRSSKYSCGGNYNLRDIKCIKKINIKKKKRL